MMRAVRLPIRPSVRLFHISISTTVHFCANGNEACTVDMPVSNFRRVGHINSTQPDTDACVCPTRM